MNNMRLHPDLPVILEEATSPSSSYSALEDVEITPNEDTTDDGNNQEDIILDESDAESFTNNSINSYAFTLDNVGFDEENSLVGSSSLLIDSMDVGVNQSSNQSSTFNTSGEGGLLGVSSSMNSVTQEVHTPPSFQQEQQHTTTEECRISKRERVHRETCRTLSLPFSSPESSPSSSSNCSESESTILGSISVSSCSQTTTDNDDATSNDVDNRKKSKIDKMWPWPSKKKTASIEENADEIVPLDTMTNNDNDEIENSPKKSSVSEAISTYTSKFKDAISSFNDAYQKSKAATSNSESKGDVEDLNMSGDTKQSSTQDINNNDSDCLPNHMKRTIQNLLPNLQPAWIDKYKNANPMIKLCVLGFILFTLLLVVIIVVASVGIKDEGGGGRGTSEDILNEVFGNDSVSTMTTVVDSSASDDVSNVICVDSTSKHKNSRGKNRNCSWLTMHNEKELYTDRLDVECGAVGRLEASQLALNCQHSCRGYNGCPLSPEDLMKDEEYKKEEEKEDDWEWFDALANKKDQKDNDEEEVDNPFNLRDENDVKETESATTVQTLPGDPVYLPIGSQTETTTSVEEQPSILDTEVVESTVQEDAVMQEDTTAVNDSNNTVSTFINIRGRERPCSWLDSRYDNQRSFRREANCIMFDVQKACPASCEAYIMTSVNEESTQQTVDSDIRVPYTINKEGIINMEMPNSQVDDFNNIQPLSSEVLTFAKGLPEATAPPQLLRSTICSDNEGYYLNNFERVEQCLWLINSEDPTDESRRMFNCGYPNSKEYSTSTDLGKMCKATCGTCGL